MNFSLNPEFYGLRGNNSALKIMQEFQGNVGKFNDKFEGKNYSKLLIESVPVFIETSLNDNPKLAILGESKEMNLQIKNIIEGRTGCQLF